jgi:hypothetical protein
MNRQADQWIKWTTTGCVGLLALIAGTVSYLHMHTLVGLHGQPGWVATLTPLSVDGMIVAASMTLLADSRSGRGALPWALLVAGSVASLAANVTVAEPTLVGRVIAAWPSFALTASYELLTRQVRRSAVGEDEQSAVPATAKPTPMLRLALVSRPQRGRVGGPSGGDLQRQAWQWALANRASDGTLPSGSAIAFTHGRHERWGRLVKSAGLAGAYNGDGVPGLRPATDEPMREDGTAGAAGFR